MLAVYLLAVAIGAGIAYQQIGLRRAPRPPGALVDIGGRRLHATCGGAGDPLVLLEAAIAGSSLSWSIVQPGIANLTEVCAYDRAGLGWSDPPPRPPTFADILDDLHSLMARIADRRPVVLVGHSFGSLVVRAYAARHPERLVGLVLVDPPLEWVSLTSERVRLLWGGRQMSRIGAVLARLGVVRLCLSLLTGGAPAAPRRFVRIFGARTAATLERMVGEVRKLPPSVHPLVQAIWCQPKCFRAMGDYMQVFEREAASIVDMEPPRSIAVTVISSRDQSPEQLASHRALAARSAVGRHVVAARSQHWIPFDEPDIIVAAVAGMIGPGPTSGRVE